MTPMFQGEVQFRRYSDTSTQGQQLVFAVHGRDELEAFIGKEGKRFMAVLVEIGDDEQPVDVRNRTSEPKPREHLGDLCYRAVMWCNDPEFQQWIYGGDADGPVNAEVARTIILDACGVDSRKKLDTVPEAGEKFKRLIVGPWQKHQMARRSA